MDKFVDFSHLSNAALFGRTMVLMGGVGTTVKRYFGHLKLNLKEAWASFVLALFAVMHGLLPFLGGFRAAYMQCKGVRNTFRFIPLHPAYRSLYKEMHEFYTSDEFNELLEERGLNEDTMR